MTPMCLSLLKLYNMKVKIEQRTVYHKFVELELEIPDSIETDKIDEYLLSIEDEWIDKIDDKINKTYKKGQFSC